MQVDIWIFSTFYRLVHHYGFNLIVKFLHGSCTSATSCLIGSHMYPGDWRKVLDGFQGHHHNNSWTVRVGNKYFWACSCNRRGLPLVQQEAHQCPCGKALELSIITAPYFVMVPANSFEVPAPADARAISIPLKSSFCLSSFTVRRLPPIIL